MSEEFENIGNLFRNTLKDHRMESDAHLWGRLDSQLSAQTPVSVPKTSVVRHLTWVKVAVAASVITGVALAFNYIYLPLKNTKPIIETQKNINNIKPSESVIDSSSDEKEIKNQQILERKEGLIDNAINRKLVNKQTNNKLLKAGNNNTLPNNNNTLPYYNNNMQPANQQNNTIANTTQNPVNSNPTTQNNSVNKVIPKKDSLYQSVTDNNSDKIQPNQNTTAYQDVQKNDNDIITATDIPNIFTPNNDGFNDYFVIKNIEKCSSNHLVIKDRNGKTVFEKINYQNDWDGKNTADGVYFFFLKYNTTNGNFGKMGSITIKRQ